MLLRVDSFFFPFLSLAFFCMNDANTTRTDALVEGQRGELELGEVRFRRAAAAAVAVSVPAMKDEFIKGLLQQ